MSFIPLEEIQTRIKKLQSAMGRDGFDGALIVQRVDLFYYSGTGQDAHLFVPAEGDPVLLVRKDFRRAAEESPLEAVIEIKSFSELKKNVLDGTGGRLGTLGMELDVLPVNNWQAYLKLFAGTEIKDISPHVKRQRMVKSAYELAVMKRAALMNEGLYLAVPDLLEEGLTEIEFSGRLEALYRAKGHQGYVRVRGFNQEVFYGHVMSGGNLAVASCSVGPTGGPGVNPSMPQGPGIKRIERHEPIQIDYVGVVDGYMVDQARTYYLGEPPEEFRLVHAAALAIQERLVRDGRSGVRCEELYLTALSMAEEAGRSEGFLGYPQPVPFVGHGVGLELDELPLVGRKSPTVLEEGMVIALEPKFIFPGRGLAGIENTFLVTATGLERMTLVDDEICVVH